MKLLASARYGPTRPVPCYQTEAAIMWDDPVLGAVQPLGRAATTQAALAAMLLTQPPAGTEIEPDAASLIVAMPLGPLA
jgi:hypothetical protein